jgi:hypothetical protein
MKKARIVIALLSISMMLLLGSYFKVNASAPNGLVYKKMPANLDDDCYGSGGNCLVEVEIIELKKPPIS